MYRTGNCTFYERPWEINLSDQQEKKSSRHWNFSSAKGMGCTRVQGRWDWGGSCSSDAPGMLLPHPHHLHPDNISDPSWGWHHTSPKIPADWEEHKKTPRIQRFSWSFKQPELFNSLKMVQSKFIDNYSANILSSPCGQNHLSNPLISNFGFLLFCYQIPPRKLPRSILKQLRFLLQHYVWWRVSKIQCGD